MAGTRLKKLAGFKDFPEIIDHRFDDSAGFNESSDWVAPSSQLRQRVSKTGIERPRPAA
jgi:hypothetical protein